MKKRKDWSVEDIARELRKEYAKGHITKEELQELVELAEECHGEGKVSQRQGMGEMMPFPVVNKDDGRKTNEEHERNAMGKTCYGTYENVWLSDGEVETVRKKYSNSDELITLLSKHKFNEKKEYASDYAALLMFGREDGKKKRRIKLIRRRQK